MSVNSKQPALKINQWLTVAAEKLRAADISTAHLDAELILAHALGRNRTWLLAHDSETFNYADADELLQKRIQRIPLAYLTGHKEFYGRDFTVNEHVLIPRPDTEEIIEQLKLLAPHKSQRLIDIGTGSGAIAITAKLEFPDLQVEAVDVSRSALIIAGQNATTHQAKVEFYESNLLGATRNTYNFILANLPYVDQIWKRSTETDYEPPLALFADDAGLALIKKCIEQAHDKLVPSGYLLLEADPRQFDEIIGFAMQHELKPIRINEYVMTLQRSK